MTAVDVVLQLAFLTASGAALAAVVALWAAVARRRPLRRRRASGRH